MTTMLLVFVCFNGDVDDSDEDQLAVTITARHMLMVVAIVIAGSIASP